MRPFLPPVPVLLFLFALLTTPVWSQESETPYDGLLPPGSAADLVADRGVPAPGYGPLPYVIVTSRDLRPAFRALARERIRAGLPSAVRSLESLRDAYPSAVDDADRVRRFLHDAHAHWQTRYVLLGGDTDVIPARFVTTITLLGERRFASDWYFACLDGTWDADGDGRYGEAADFATGEPGDDPDLVPELYLGRAPVSDGEEARRFVAKTLAYERRPADAFETTTLLFANRLIPGPFGLDLAQFAERLLPLITDDPAQEVTRLYESWDDPAWLPGALPETPESVVQALDRGANVVLGFGAGSPDLLEAGPRHGPDPYLTTADVLGLTNGERAGHVWLLTSLVGAFDQPTSLAEAFLRAPAGGAVTVIAPTDITFLFESSVLTERFTEVVFDEGAATIGEAVVRARAGLVSGGPLIAMTYQLLGDPLLRIFSASPVASGGEGPDHGRTDIMRRAPPGEGEEARDAPTVIGARDTQASGRRGQGGSQPMRIVFSPPAPSPAATRARIACTLPAELAGAPLTVDILDLAGRTVRVLERGSARAGVSTLSWDLRSDRGERVRPGIYFVRVAAGGIRRTTRLMVAPGS